MIVKNEKTLIARNHCFKNYEIQDFKRNLQIMEVIFSLKIYL